MRLAKFKVGVGSMRPPEVRGAGGEKMTMDPEKEAATWE